MIASSVLVAESGTSRLTGSGVRPSSVRSPLGVQRHTVWLCIATIRSARAVAEPILTQDLTPYRQPASAPAAPRERGQGPTTDEIPISMAALATSPARDGLADKAPGPAPAPATAAQAARPVDPRIVFSRNH